MIAVVVILKVLSWYFNKFLGHSLLGWRLPVDGRLAHLGAVHKDQCFSKNETCLKGGGLSQCRTFCHLWGTLIFLKMLYHTEM